MSYLNWTSLFLREIYSTIGKFVLTHFACSKQSIQIFIHLTQDEYVRKWYKQYKN